MKHTSICMIVLNTLDPDPRVWKEGRSLAASGHRVTILAMKGKGQSPKKEEDGILLWRMFDHPLYDLKFWNTLPVWLRFLSFVLNPQRQPFDVCHCHDAETLPIAFLLARRDGARLIYDVHELIFSYVPLSDVQPYRKRVILFLYRLVLRLSERILIKKTNAVITVNHSLARILHKYYRLKKAPFFLLNTRKKAEVPKTDYIRRKTNLEEAQRILFYQGTIRKDRELERIIRLLPLLDERIVFVIAGMPGPETYLNQLQSLASDLAVKDRFYYLGFLNYEDELLEATASADIGLFFLPGNNLTYKYSLANKFFDYLMANLPMITSDLPEMRRIIRKYQIGFSVDIHDQESCLRTIHRLVLDEKLYQGMVQNMEKAKEALCWEKEEEKLLLIYEGILGENDCKRCG